MGHGWIPYSRSPQDHVGWTNIWHSAMKYISKDRPGKTTDIEPKLPHLSSFGVRTKNFGEVLGNFYKMQATEQRLLSFPSGSACSLNELSFNVFASFHSGSSRNPSRDEGTREERLLESWTAGSWEFFWILRDWWPRKHATAAVKPYSSMLQFLISCVREKKKKKRLLLRLLRDCSRLIFVLGK